MRFIIKPIAWALIACLVNNPIYGFYFVTGLIFFKPFPALADEFLNQAGEGQSVAAGLMTDYSIPNVDGSTGQLTLTNGLVAGQTVQQNELFQEIQPGSMDAIAASYGDAAALGMQVNNNLGPLTTGTSTHAYAYQTLMGANTAMPNIYNDPIWKTSDDIYSLKSPLINDLFNGCEKKTNFSEKSCPIHVEDLKTCKKTLTTESCKVTRVVTKKPSAITKESGDGLFTEVSAQEISIELGNRDIHSQGKGCPAVIWTMIINVTDPSQINSVTITAAGADDNVMLTIDGNNVFQTGGCSDRSGWQQGYNIDITGALNTAGQHTISLSVLTGSPTHDGGGFLVMNILKNADNVDETFLDFPAGCRQRMFDNWPPDGTAPPFTSDGSLNDQASTDWWKCTEASDSKVISGVTITPDPYGQYLKPILPAAPATPPAPICYAAETRVPGRVTLPCFTDKDGYEVCPDFDYITSEHTSCDELTANPQCVYIGESCAAGAVDRITGACPEFIITYDCGKDYPAQCGQVNDGEKTICDSPIRCMGGECLSQETESNEDFVKAATGLQLLNQAQQSNGCDGSSGDCALFPGEPRECQMADVAVLGEVDCCNMPMEASWIDYMQLAANTWELADTSVEAYGIASTGISEGAWSLLANDTVFSTPVNLMSDAYSAITETFSSAYDSVASMLGEKLGVSLGIDAIEAQATQWLGEWVANIFGETVASTLLTTTTTTTAGVTTASYTMAGSLLSSIVTAVGIIYALYQIAKLVVQLVFACTKEEIELNMLKQQKLCTDPTEIGTYCSSKWLGSCVARKEAYCCFSSPFAKIFQQQARPQLGKSFGDPKEPTCEGLPISDIKKLDFKKMDFSEWINMLKISNQLPSDSLTAEAMYDKAIVTKGKLPNTDKYNAQDRINTQTNGSDIDAVRQHMLDNL